MRRVVRGDERVQENASGGESADLHRADRHVEHRAAEKITALTDDPVEQPVSCRAGQGGPETEARDDREVRPDGHPRNGQRAVPAAEANDRPPMTARGASRSAADSNVAAPITCVSDGPNMASAASNGEPVAP